MESHIEAELLSTVEFEEMKKNVQFIEKNPAS
jgi:hypothetical protein